MAMRVTYLVLDGEIISENRNGVERDYLPDPQGNTVALLDNTQTKTDTFTYWPYGELVNRTGTTPTPFQYGGAWGYYTDSSSRLYVRARCPDVVKGRWMTEDPIGFDGGDWNLYRYCSTQPTSKIDPSGNAFSENPCAGKAKPSACPNGKDPVCVTCYGRFPKGSPYGGPIMGGGPCGKSRPPQSGDCAYDQKNPICDDTRGKDINIPFVGGSVKCRACDAGQGHSGVDVYIEAPDGPGHWGDCEKQFKAITGGKGTGWYCPTCSPHKPFVFPEPRKNPNPRPPIFPFPGGDLPRKCWMPIITVPITVD